jgi:hypothetical protein
MGSGYSRRMMYGQQPPAIDLDRLRVDLAEARDRVRDLEQLIILAERWYGRGSSTIASRDSQELKGEAKDKSVAPPPVAPAEGPLADLGAREAAVQLLRTTGAVWTVEQATKEMLRLGWRTNSPEPETVVRSAMARDPRLTKVAPGQFRYYSPNGSGEVNDMPVQDTDAEHEERPSEGIA